MEESKAAGLINKSNAWNGPREWVCFAILSAICAAWYATHAIAALIPGAGHSDFEWYYLAAQHIVHGQSPFLAVGYIYPPLSAFLFTPLTALEYVPARRAWFALSHLFLVVAAWFVWRRLGGSWRAASVVAFVWASGGAAEENLALGQIGPLLVLLVAVASFPGRLQAAAIGLGFAIKVFPGVLGSVFVLLRNWRKLVVTILSAALLTAVPWLALRLWFTGPSAPASSAFLAGTPTILSWSVPSIALRVKHPPGADGKPPTQWLDNNLAATHIQRSDRVLSLSMAAVMMIAGLGTAWRASGRCLNSESVPYLCAALISLTLAAAPVCWTHYQLLQYPGAAILLHRALRERKWAELAAVLASWLFVYTVPVTVLRAAYSVRREWPSGPPYLYFWTSVSAAASLCLFGLAVRAMRAAQERSTALTS